MFKHLTIFRAKGIPSGIDDALRLAAFAPTAPTQAMSVGFSEPRHVEGGAFAEQINGWTFMELTIETRTVPAQTLRKAVDEMAARIEQETGRRPGNKRRRELKDEATLTLLPHVFPRMAKVRGCLTKPDEHGLSFLLIDANGAPKADLFATEFIRALSGLAEGMALMRFMTTTDPMSAMTTWLKDGEAMGDFSVGRAALLKAQDETKATVRYSRTCLDTDEVRDRIAQGMCAEQLDLSYAGRVGFTLTDTMSLTKINFEDVVFEGRTSNGTDEAFDADAAIFSGEMDSLLQDLIEALGGELPVQVD